MTGLRGTQGPFSPFALSATMARRGRAKAFRRNLGPWLSSAKHGRNSQIPFALSLSKGSGSYLTGCEEPAPTTLSKSKGGLRANGDFVPVRSTGILSLFLESLSKRSV